MRGYAVMSRSNDSQVIGPQLLPESWIDYSALDIVAISLSLLDKISPRRAVRSSSGRRPWYARRLRRGKRPRRSNDLARLLDLANQPPQFRKWQRADPGLHRPITITDESVRTGGRRHCRPLRPPSRRRVQSRGRTGEVDPRRQSGSLANNARSLLGGSICWPGRCLPFREIRFPAPRSIGPGG